MFVRFGDDVTTIGDVYLSNEDEAKLLRCFLGNNDMLLFTERKWNCDRDSKLNEFVEQRKLFTSIEPCEPFPEIGFTDTETETIWYKITSFKDLFRVYRHSGSITYRCYIFPEKSTSPKDFRFEIFAYEHMYDDPDEGDYRGLWVTESNSGDFVENVLPKLMELHPDLAIQ